MSFRKLSNKEASVPPAGASFCLNNWSPSPVVEMVPMKYLKCCRVLLKVVFVTKFALISGGSDELGPTVYRRAGLDGVDIVRLVTILFKANTT